MSQAGQLVASGTIQGAGGSHAEQNIHIPAASPHEAGSLYEIRICNLIAQALTVTVRDAQRNSAGTIIYCPLTSFTVAASVGKSVLVQGWLLTDGQLGIDPAANGANAVDFFVYRA